MPGKFCRSGADGADEDDVWHSTRVMQQTSHALRQVCAGQSVRAKSCILLMRNVFVAQHKGNAAYTKCAQQGVAVKPVKGDAVLLYNLLENGRNDGASLHEVCQRSRNLTTR